MVNAKKTLKEEGEKEKKRNGLILSILMGDKKINRWILPLIILILIIFFGYYTGLFNPENPNSNPDPDVYKFPKNLIIGKNWSFNFSNHLLPLLIKEKDTSTPYIFYIGSGAGSLPEGFVLNANGVLAGKPTGNGYQSYFAF